MISWLDDVEGHVKGHVIVRDPDTLLEALRALGVVVRSQRGLGRRMRVRLRFS